MAMISGLRPLSLFWRRQAPTSPAERYYITPWAEPSNRPEGEADPGLNPWRPGPKAPAAASTLGPKGRQPSGIPPSAAISPQGPSPQISHTAKKH